MRMARTAALPSVAPRMIASLSSFFSLGGIVVVAGMVVVVGGRVVGRGVDGDGVVGLLTDVVGNTEIIPT